MNEPEPTKAELTAKLNEMIALWPARWIGYLLAEAEKMHQAAIRKPITDSKGRVFSKFQMCHIHDETGERPLCGQGHHIGSSRLISAGDFHELPAASRCTKCQKSLNKLNGKEILAGDGAYTWLRDSQVQLLQSLFEKAGIGVWTDIDRQLVKQAAYIDRASLMRGVRSLKRRGMVERKLVGNQIHVRLTEIALEFVRQKKQVKQNPAIEGEPE